MSYSIHIPISGGKAGKGLNKTGSVQVRKDGFILKQFRYRVGDFDARYAARRSAAEFINQHKAANEPK